MKKKSFCGMCGTAQIRVPVPEAERGPWSSFIDPAGLKLLPPFLAKHVSNTSSTSLYILGLEKDVPDWAVRKFRLKRVEITPVMLDQWGCPKCETIHSYWYRKDGKEGALYHTTRERQKGKGPNLREEFEGDMEKIKSGIST